MKRSLSTSLAAVLALTALTGPAANAADLIWTGTGTDTNFNTGSNYVGGAFTEWTNYVFDSNVINGSMNVGVNRGWGNITLKSGLTKDIVISGANPILMAPGMVGTQYFPDNGINSYGGKITIEAGSSNLTINNQYLSAGPETWDVGSGRTLTINGQFGDWVSAASLTKEGSGTAVLTGASSYTGATTINNGTLKLQGGAFSTTARSYSIASGAVLNIDGNTGVALGTTTISGTGTLRITGGSLENGTGSGRNISMELGSGALIDIQSGAKIQNGGWQSMTWTNNRAGMQVDGSFDVWDGLPVTIDALTGSGTVDKNHGGNSPTLLTVGVADGNGTFSGTIKNSQAQIALTKTGTGTQILTGSSNYSGSTTVNGGTLQIGTGGTLGGTGSTTVNGGSLIVSGAINGTSSLTISGTLGGHGSITTPGSVTFNSGGKLSLGGTAGALTITATTLDLSGAAGADAGAFVFRLGVTKSDVVNLTGTLEAGSYYLGMNDFTFSDAGDLVAGTYTLFHTSNTIGGALDDYNLTASFGNGFTGTLGFSGDGHDLTLLVVPEPGTYAMLATGFGFLAGLRRFRRSL